jgi:hypothetical protein
MPDDEILLNMARAGIADLNARYPGMVAHRAFISSSA